MLERLNADLAHEQEDISETERTAENLETLLLDAQEELKATKRQRIRDMARHPEQEAILEETYDELEHDLIQRINGLQNQLQMAADKRNTIIQVNRAAKTAMEVFDDLLSKEHLDRKDLQLIIEKIKVYEDHLAFRLKADIDCLLRSGALPHEDDAVAAMAIVEVGGANSVYACASHGVLSGPALERLNNSVIKEVALLNTIPESMGEGCSKIKYISVATMFAEAIERIYQEISIAKLFN